MCTGMQLILLRGCSPCGIKQMYASGHDTKQIKQMYASGHDTKQIKQIYESVVMTPNRLNKYTQVVMTPNRSNKYTQVAMTRQAQIKRTQTLLSDTAKSSCLQAEPSPWYQRVWPKHGPPVRLARTIDIQCTVPKFNHPAPQKKYLVLQIRNQSAPPTIFIIIQSAGHF